MTTRARRLVYVSGAPGAGKTTLAGPLAAELGYALITKAGLRDEDELAGGAAGGQVLVRAAGVR